MKMEGSLWAEMLKITQFDYPTADLPSVSTTVLPQPKIPSETIENRQRLIQP